MASETCLLFLPNEGEQIENRIASCAKYSLLEPRFDEISLLLANSSSIQELLEMLRSKKMLIKFIENYTKIDNIKLLNSSLKCLDNPKHNILVLTNKHNFD